MNINDMEIAKSLFNPKKIRILKQVGSEGKTVKEIAEALNEKPSRLYYHVNQLKDQGLLEVHDTKQVGHLTETYYIAKQNMGPYDLDTKFTQENQEFVVQQLLQYINKGINQLNSDIARGAGESDHTAQASILRTELSHNEWRELNEEIKALVNKKEKEYKAKGPAERKNMTYILMSYEEEKEE